MRQATARGKGAIGRHPLCYREAARRAPRIYAHKKRKLTLLDYSCGTGDQAAQLLQDLTTEGIKALIVHYDLHPSYRDPARDGRRYDLVIASNVLNVQETEEQLSRTLQHLHNISLHSGCQVLCNYPNNPRKLGINLATLLERIEAAGFTISRAHGYKSPVFYLTPHT